MNQQNNELIINGQTYVLKGSEKESEPAADLDGLEYKIVRTQSAGVFAGYIEGKDGQNVILLKARRLWYWSGAASLSQLAIDGTSKPKECKFPEEVSRIELTQAIEILDVTAKAKKSIESVSVWKA